jgi:serine/threonine protein phosphatase 1
MIYAIGDIHGMYFKLVALYKQIRSDIIARNLDHATIIFLGDYVDRGPDSDRVLDFLMGVDAIDADVNHIFLKGNHEDMMVNVYHRDGHVDMWVTNGGRQTLDAFECVTELDFYENPKFREWMNWCATRPTLYVMGRYAFVHGGYDCRETAGKQNPDVLMWKRTSDYMWGKDYDNCEFVVVHGHTVSSEAVMFRNEIGVDTGACSGGVLTAACLPECISAYSATEIENMTEAQVDSILNEEISFLTA